MLQTNSVFRSFYHLLEADHLETLQVRNGHQYSSNKAQQTKASGFTHLIEDFAAIIMCGL